MPDWLFIEVDFILSMRQQQNDMQISLSLHDIIQIMIVELQNIDI